MQTRRSTKYRDTVTEISKYNNTETATPDSDTKAIKQGNTETRRHGNIAIHVCSDTDGQKYREPTKSTEN